MCIFKIKKEFFEEYNIIDEQVYTLNVEVLSKIIKSLSKNEIEMDIEKDGFYLKGKKDKFKLNYYVALEEQRQKPNLICNSKWNIDTKVLFEKLTAFSEFNEVCKFENKNGLLSLRTKANLVEGETILDTAESPVSNDTAWYDLKMFMTISEVINLFDKITFGFTTSSPCYIHSENDLMLFEWILAPRVEETNE
jgi:hypothetical protein